MGYHLAAGALLLCGLLLVLVPAIHAFSNALHRTETKHAVNGED